MKINDKHLLALATSDLPADKEGYLKKRDHANKAFQRRWFALRGNLFFYFERQSDKEPIGVIILEGCTVEMTDDIEAFTFELSFQGSTSRTYLLAAESQEEVEDWIKVITCASYDYMKLMVSELQQQLDDINATESEQLRNAKVPDVVYQTSADSSTSSSLRISGSQRSNEVGLLVDLSHDSLNSASTVTLNSNEALRRQNPFDDSSRGLPHDSSSIVVADLLGLDSFSETNDKGLQSVNRVPPQRPPRAPSGKFSTFDFDSMHMQFGSYIMSKSKFARY